MLISSLKPRPVHASFRLFRGHFKGLNYKTVLPRKISLLMLVIPYLGSCMGGIARA